MPVPPRRNPPELQATLPVRVSPRGVLLIPDVAQESRYLRVLCQVTKDRENKSQNLRYHQPKSFYGYAQTIVNASIRQSVELCYGINEVVVVVNELANALAYAHCSVENINETIESVYGNLRAAEVPINPLIPTLEFVKVQPPYLPRIDLDEVWFTIDGMAEVAAWVEWMPLDFACDSARQTFLPRSGDRGKRPENLPNPAGQGRDGVPGAGDYQPMGAPPSGDGQGSENPNPGLAAPPGKSYWVGFTAPWYGGVVFSEDKQWGPFPTKPTATLGPNRNSAEGRYSMPVLINGSQVTVAESVGSPTTLRVGLYPN